MPFGQILRNGSHLRFGPAATINFALAGERPGVLLQGMCHFGNLLV